MKRMELIHPLAHIHRAGALSQQRCSPRPSLVITHPLAWAEEASGAGNPSRAGATFAGEVNIQGASGKKQLTPHREGWQVRSWSAQKVELQGEGSSGGTVQEMRADPRGGVLDTAWVP